MKRHLSVAAGLVLAVIACDTASAGCVPNFRWLNNQTVDVPMTVRSGKTCSVIFRSAGPTNEIVVLVRPSHGAVSVGAVGRIIYRAQSGYMGRDTFTYAYRGLDTRNNMKNAMVRVEVTVTP